MATIAKSSITLVSISDAYSVSLQPSNITINADCKGNNPELANAKTTISLFCGDEQVAISQCNVIASSVNTSDKGCTLTKSGQSYVLTITGVEKQLSGWRDIEVYTEAGQRFEARFAYTIVRETSMLDWILEWNKEYTEISGDHVATPNAFIGSADEDGKLSGVYIGGDMPDHPVGIYGIKSCDPTGFTQGNISDAEIFHLNENGGMIGGWDILPTGLFTENTIGKLQILSNGTIQYLDNNDATTPFWALKSDGSGSLAHGNIFWGVDGSATFNGKITAASGSIGGWEINAHQLYKNRVIIDSNKGFIGINACTLQKIEFGTGDYLFPDNPEGGVKMWYTSGTDFGLAGWSAGKKVFQLGSINKIAGWSFDDVSFYLGVKNNIAGTFTSASGAITIGTEGLRGHLWRVDKDGSGALAGGQIWWNTEGYCEFKGTLQAATIIGSSITGGTIQAVDYIKSENGSWQLNKDGSGQLANGNVDWGIDGHVNVSGGLRADTFELAICTTMANGYIDGSTGSFISLNTGATATVILPALSLNCARIFHLMVPSDNQKLRIGFADENVSYSIPGEENLSEDSGLSGNNKFDEDGFGVISGFGGDWMELIGIKTTKLQIQSILNKTDLTAYTANVKWVNDKLEPIVRVTPQAQTNNLPPAPSIYQTHWFILPKSSRMHWFMMAAMGLNLSSE